ncbi:MAG TPA: GxxExxY protein, partial [Candidatus Hydrogenedentes bacterium]|nr:GxxExxY protein [Candidatus Hydrogenedentota bacterium]
IVDCAVALHRETGPGLLETAHEAVLGRPLEAWGLRAARLIPIPMELRRLHFLRVLCVSFPNRRVNRIWGIMLKG